MQQLKDQRKGSTSGAERTYEYNGSPLQPSGSTTTMLGADLVLSYGSPLTKAPVPEGEVIYNIPQMGQYKGEVSGGKARGKGEFRGEDGTFYKGEWDNDLPNGQGEMKLSDGSEYRGAFFQGFPHGQGQKKWKNGNLYQGWFEKGQFHGRVAQLADVGSDGVVEDKRNIRWRMGAGKATWPRGVSLR